MKKLMILAAAATAALIASPALADKGGKGHGDKHEWKSGGKGDRDGDRRWGNGERRGDDRRDGYRSSYRNCPPGLARKHNGCQPPGQARQQWRRGYRVPNGYGSYTAYDQIPYEYRNRYNLDPDNRYIYRDNTIYQIDPRTQIIQQILGGLIR